MQVTRRDFIRASSAIAAALGLQSWGAVDALGAEGGPSVVWLQASGCSGDSVSLLNSIEHGTIDKLLLETLDLNYHPTVMAAAGSAAVAAAREAYREKGYVLIVEGAIPTANDGRYCTLWDGMTALTGVQGFARNAGFIIAAGTCACFGGVSAGKPNPTAAKGVRDVVRGKGVINIPGCPTHPDWLVGTVAYLLANGRVPPLDHLNRPTAYFGKTVHDECPYLDDYDDHCIRHRMAHADDIGGPKVLSDEGCLFAMGCKGRHAGGDCPTRGWNSGAVGAVGVNWCVTAGSPCIGCTEPGFPDRMSPFFTRLGTNAIDDND